MTFTANFLIRAILIACMLPGFAFGQIYKTYKISKEKLSIQLAEGVLTIQPLTNKVVRVQWVKEIPKEEQEFVVVNKIQVPPFKVVDTPGKLMLRTQSLTTSFDKTAGALQFINNAGKVFLSEEAGSRKLRQATVLDQPCYVAEQSF